MPLAYVLAYVLMGCWFVLFLSSPFMALLSFFFRIVQVSFIFYTVVALVFTTHGLVNLALSSPSVSSDSAHTWSSRVVSRVQQPHAPSLEPGALAPLDYGVNDADADEPWLLRGSLSDTLMHFPLSSPSAPLLRRLGMAHANSTPIRQETFLSKAFAHALHPTKIIPYYYRAKGVFDEDDVTITTLVTSNRFKVFKQLVERYKGMHTRACLISRSAQYLC